MAKGELNVEGIPALHGASAFARMWKMQDGGAACLPDPASLGADPMLYGLAIVDAIRHGAKADVAAVNVPEGHAFERIVEGVEAEPQNPIDAPRRLGPKGTH